MKLQVTIGSCTVNTTSQGLGRIFEQEDAAVFNDMLNLSRRCASKVIPSASAATASATKFAASSSVLILSY